MRRRSRALGAAAAVAAGGLAVAACGGQATSAPAGPPANTAKVHRGALQDTVSLTGILTFRARPDGAPYRAINHARGVYTKLPEPGDRVACGDVLYRVDDRPVRLLCGALPAYRDLRVGDAGRDVRQLNRTLHRLGYRTDPRSTRFTLNTRRALDKLTGDGGLALGDAVFLPGPLRIARVIAETGATARPGAPVLSATSSTPEVRVQLEPSQRDMVKEGDRAQITLPDSTPVTGTVRRLGPVTRASAGQDGPDTSVTIPVDIRLDRPARARGLDQAPVRVDITTEGVRDALSVAVTALVGRAGGGFAVEVVRGDGRRELVAVRLGLVDTAGGRVQVAGDLRPGDDVVVPAP